jgi:serine phosphatase RsbU (regulator of sigma subunit)
MYVTVAGLQFDGSAEVEYTLAGHPPILHYRQSKGDVTRCEMQQFPLGLFPEAAYAADRVQCDPGDLFAVVTDGITETTNSQDEEFGFERLEQLLSQNAARPLPEIFDVVLAANVRHGAQQDDRTLLLVRISA